MTSPKIILTKTTGTDAINVWGYTIATESYIASLTTEGDRNMQARTSTMRGIGFPSSAGGRGKPSTLIRGGDEYDPSVGCLPFVIYGNTPSAMSIGAVIRPESQSGSDVFQDGSYRGEYLAIASHVSFASLSSVVDVSSYCDNATHHYLKIPSGLINYSSFYNINSWTEVPLRIPCVHAFDIDSGSDIPSFFDTSPTHVVIRGGVDVGWHVPVDASAGWYMNPSDMVSFHSSRKINGNLVSAGMLGRGGVWGDSVAYARSDASSAYVGADIGANTYTVALGFIRRYAPPDSLAVFITGDDNDPNGYQYVQIFASLSLHRGIPPITVRYYENDTAPGDSYIQLRVTFYPTYKTETINAYALYENDPIDATFPADLSGLTIPADATSCKIEAYYEGGFSTTSTVSIVAPDHMHGCNPQQSSDWPAVVPGYVRELTIP